MTTVAAYLGLVGFCWLALFQLILAFGAPLGHMAWGGAHRTLPGSQRFASLFIAGLALVGAATVAQAGGIGPALLPNAVMRPLLWIFAALFLISLVGNAVSRSRAERAHGVPLAFVLSASCGTLGTFSGT